MRIGILGDIHSNLEALQAVVDKMRGEEIDNWVQVGDIVGYGADPRPCLALVQELDCTVCIGNHDAAVVGILDTEYFNTYARAAIDWTRGQLQQDDLDYLRNLPLLVEHNEYTVVHGSQYKPEQFGYVLSKVEAVESMRVQRTKMAFVGHSHVPAMYLQREGSELSELEVLYDSEIDARITSFSRVLMNVGSVGQPRDEDKRAAYGIYDTETGEARISRVSYDIETTQKKIREAGLPPVLADRLSLGV
ncbi:MAG: metallophosphoesterase family protein [Planctomycetota bacterium]|jgi:diadenosine tetraphosphatase ApaH/serine/threonine PP2A family protein phosphatase